MFNKTVKESESPLSYHFIVCIICLFWPSWLWFQKTTHTCTARVHRFIFVWQWLACFC